MHTPLNTPTTPWSREWTHSNLVGLSQLPPPSFFENTLLDHYVWMRAHTILGNYRTTTTHLDSLRDSLQASSSQGPWAFCVPLLSQVQVAALQLKDLRLQERLLEGMRALSTSFPPLLQAEFHFTRGLVFSLSSEYRKALDAYFVAVAHYENQGFLVQAGMTHFNVVVCANHLGLKSLRSYHQKKMETLAHITGDSALMGMLARFDGYRAMDIEDVETAVHQFEEAAQHFKTTGRRRDEQNVLGHLAYLSLKEERLDRFKTLFDEIKLLSVTGEVITRRMEAFNEVSQLGLPTLGQVEMIWQTQRSSGLDSVSLYYLADLLLTWLGRYKNFSAVIRFYSSIKNFLKNSEIVPWLLDLRPHLIEAYGSLGHHLEAYAILTEFEADSSAEEAHARLIQAQKLRKRFFGTQSPFPGQPLETTEAKNVCVLDLEKEEVRTQKSKISLRSQTLLMKFLTLLVHYEQGIDYEALFELCYGLPFDPIRHQSRYHSLIARSRQVLGTDRILWRNGIIQLAWDNRFVVYGKKNAWNQKKKRRSRMILAYLKSFGRPVPLSQLERRFQVSRRTLQLDLKDLLSTQMISKTGFGKATLYTAASGKVQNG